MTNDNRPSETGGKTAPEGSTQRRTLRRLFVTAVVTAVVMTIVFVAAKLIVEREFGNLTAYSAAEILQAKSACEQHADDDQWWQCWLQEMRTLDSN